jgi:YbbR domain-containing protein
MSLILALVLWAVVRSIDSSAPPEQVYVPLTFAGISPKLVVVDPPSQIPVVVSAPPDQLKEIKSATLLGRVNLSSAQSGKGRYSVALPALLRDVTTPSLPQVDLLIEPVERRVLKVEIGTVGLLNDRSVVLVDRYWVPKTVTVSGPQSKVAKVAHARVTLDLSKLDPAHPSPYEDYIYLYDGNNVQIQEVREGLTIDNPTARIQTVFDSALQEKTLSVLVPVKGKPNLGYLTGPMDVSPPTVVVTGKSLALASLTQVETEQIDLTGLTRDKQFTVRVVRPLGVKVSVPSQVKVRISIRPQAPASRP